MSVHVKRMWGGGPLRMFSTKQTPQTTIRYHNADCDGYAGSYVCELCERPCNGVYFVRSESKWLCGACRELVGPAKGLQPEHLKRKPKSLDSRMPK